MADREKNMSILLNDSEKKLAFLLATSPHFMLVGGSSTYGKAAKDLIANGVVAREKGEWVPTYHTYYNRDGKCQIADEFHCSKCEIYSRDEWHFCPNCGSDMRAEEQNRARSDCDSVDICIECWDEWLEMPAKDGEDG